MGNSRSWRTRHSLQSGTFGVHVRGRYQCSCFRRDFGPYRKTTIPSHPAHPHRSYRHRTHRADQSTGNGAVLVIIALLLSVCSCVSTMDMLPNVARHSSVGMISGYGVALGYVGSIAGLVLVKPFVADGGRTAAFLPTATLFLIFSIPCFLFVKDPDPKPFQVDVGKASALSRRRLQTHRSIMFY